MNRGKTAIAAVVLLAGLLMPAGGRASAAEVKMKFSVEGMTCASSAARATYAAEAVAGVKSAVDDTDDSSLVITFDDQRTSAEEIKKGLTRGGFPMAMEPIPVK